MIFGTNLRTLSVGLMKCVRARRQRKQEKISIFVLTRQVHVQLAQRKGLKFHQTRCNAIILYDTLPSLLYLES